MVRILIADADPVVREGLRRLVEELGDEALLAADGDQAWSLLRKHACGAVISGWALPGCGGVELVRRIRRHDDLDAYTYVIVLTAPDEHHAIDEAVAAGVDDHLPMPVQRGELLARLAVARRLVSLHRGIEERNRLLSEANRRMRRDLAAASSAQKALLPIELPKAPGYRVGWRYQPCEECAGDLLGVQRLGPDHLGLHIFDVSGHGVSAALLAVQVARVISGLTGFRGDQPPARPLAVVETVNGVFHSPGSLCFLTLAYGVLDLHRNRLSLASCAHPAPLLLRADGGLVQPELIAHPLGLFPTGQAQFATWETALLPGDRLLFISDGVVEASGRTPLSDGEPEPFGIERLHTTWREARTVPLEDALTAVMDALAEWRGQGRIQDDITLLAVERVAV